MILQGKINILGWVKSFSIYYLLLISTALIYLEFAWKDSIQFNLTSIIQMTEYNINLFMVISSFLYLYRINTKTIVQVKIYTNHIEFVRRFHSNITCSFLDITVHTVQPVFLYKSFTIYVRGHGIVTLSTKDYINHHEIATYLLYVNTHKYEKKIQWAQCHIPEKSIYSHGYHSKPKKKFIPLGIPKIESRVALHWITYLGASLTLLIMFGMGWLYLYLQEENKTFEQILIHMGLGFGLLGFVACYIFIQLYKNSLGFVLTRQRLLVYGWGRLFLAKRYRLSQLEWIEVHITPTYSNYSVAHRGNYSLHLVYKKRKKQVRRKVVKLGSKQMTDEHWDRLCKGFEARQIDLFILDHHTLIKSDELY
jgi:hypothetical protein